MSNESIDQQLPDNDDLDIKSIAIKFGFAGGLISIIISLLTFIAGLQYENATKWLSSYMTMITIFAGIYYISTLDNKKKLKYGDYFKNGIIISFILSIISILYFYCYTSFIDHDFIDNLLELQSKEMYKKGLSEEQIEMALKYSKNLMTPTLMMIISFFTTIIFGILISLLASVVGLSNSQNKGLNLNERYISTNGRIRRIVYASRIIILDIVCLFFPIIIAQYINNDFAFRIILILTLIFIYGLTIIQSIKRLHDIGSNGWYVLLLFIPVVNIVLNIILIFKEGENKSNEYGQNPKLIFIS